jgi:hypothetical protein
MINPDNIFKSLERILWVKIYLNYLMRIRDPGSGSRMEKIWIRDGKISDLGSGINIPDPQR